MKNKILIKSLEKRLKEAMDRQVKPDIFRASNSGQCTRKLAYLYHNFKPDLLINYEQATDKQEFIYANRILGRSSLVFDLGHTIEEQLADILAEDLKERQKEAISDFGTFKLSGHIDGIYTDKQGLNWIIDIKSTNTRHFNNEVVKGLIDESYKFQAHCYMKALNIPRFIFLYYNKDTSHLEENKLYYDTDIIDKIKEKYTKVLNSTPDKLPPKDYDVACKKQGWHCTYCDYFLQCCNEMKLDFVKGKPKAVNKKELEK